MIHRRVDISQSGRVWMVLAGLAVMLYVLWQLSNSITAGSTKTALLLAAAFAAFFVAGRIAEDWRSGVYFFFIWLLFEDLVRKYMGNNMYIYFVKDVLVGVTYIALLAERTKRDTPLLRVPFRHALGVFVLLGFVQVFNPHSPSIFYGLLGLKLYFYYIPLMFVGYAMLRKEDDLRRLLVVNMALAAVIASVGIIQAIVSMEFLNPLNSGADIEELSHLVRYIPGSGIGVERPPSVFVSDGRFGAYLLVIFILGLGAAGYLLLKAKRGRIVVFPALALVVVAIMLLGSRGSFAYAGGSALVLTTGMLWGAPPGRLGNYRLVKAIRRSFVLIAVTVSLAVVLFPDVVGVRWTFYRETLSPSSETFEGGNRIWGYPLGQLQIALADPYWVTGRGIGTASLGAQYVARIFEVPPANWWVENGLGDMIMELGILGPILWLLFASALVYSALKSTLRLKGPGPFRWPYRSYGSRFFWCFLLPGVPSIHIRTLSPMPIFGCW